MANSALKTIVFVVAVASASLWVPRSNASSSEPPYQAFDSAFESGLAAPKKATGISESATDKQVLGKADLQLLIGVKAVAGAKRSLYFVELTKVGASQTNSASAVFAIFHTNRIDWPDPTSHSNMAFEFVYKLAPLRVRVFDENAHLLKQGQALVPWELMTNSLAEACRVCVAMQAIQAMPAEDQQQRRQALEHLLGGSSTEPIDWARVMRPVAGGLLTLGGLFGECLSTPALNDICEKSQCVIRMPGAWTMLSTAMGAKLDLALDPRFLTDVAVVKSKDGGSEPLYRFPADLKSGKRKLVSVEFIVGPSTGAQVMLAGIRSIRAVHPTKPDRQFIAQVLAVGTARQE